MINLIAKNKITAYITQHPEAATALLVWLKEYSAREEKSIARMLELPHTETLFTSMAGVGKGNYQVEYQTNLAAKAARVLWIGSRAELEAREQEKLKQLEAKYPGSQRLKIVTQVLMPPPLSATGEPAIGTTVTHQTTSTPIRKQPEIIETPYTESDADFKTRAEYENALSRIIEIFDSVPAAPEFDEVTKLIPLIAHYEQHKLTFPELNMLDVVKYKMNLFEIVPEHLTPVIGTTDEVNLYLAGKQSLPLEKQDKLYKLLFIGFWI